MKSLMETIMNENTPYPTYKAFNSVDREITGEFIYDLSESVKDIKTAIYLREITSEIPTNL